MDALRRGRVERLVKPAIAGKEALRGAVCGGLIRRIFLALVSGWLAVAALEACSSSSETPFGNADAGTHDGTAASSDGSGEADAFNPPEASGTTGEAGLDPSVPGDSGSGADTGSGHDSGIGLDAAEEAAMDAGSSEAAPECGSSPTLHVDEAGSIYCGFGDGGALVCAAGQECCLGGALGGSQFAAQACADFGAACPNVGVPEAGAPAIPIECEQISDCVANGIGQPVACCLQGATAPAVTPGCTYPKSTMGTAIVCESSGAGVTPGACATGEVQMCSSQADCPAGMTCMPGRWKIFEVGFCL